MAKSKAQQLLFQAAGWNLTGSQSAMLQAQAAAAAALQGKFSELQKTSLALANVFGAVEGKIKGMVSAGLAGTTMGNYLNYQFKQLNMQVASTFLPLFEKVSKVLQDVTDWFRQLTGAQQDQIARWLGIAVGLTAVLALVPKLISAFQTLNLVLSTIAATNPILLIVAAVAALLLATEEGRQALADMGKMLWDAFGPIILNLIKQMGPIIADLSRLLAELLRALMPLLQLLVSLAAALLKAFGPLIQVAIQALVGLVGGLLEVFKPLLDILAKIIDFINEILDLLPDIPGTLANLTNLPGDIIGRPRPGQEPKDKGQRRDLQLGISGTEQDPRQTIRRLEEAFLKTDVGERNAKAAEAAEKLLANIWDWLRGWGPQGDKKEKAPMED